MACMKMCGFNPKCDERKANKQDSKKQKNVNRRGKNVNQVTRVQRQRSKETQSARVTVIIVW